MLLQCPRANFYSAFGDYKDWDMDWSLKADVVDCCDFWVDTEGVSDSQQHLDPALVIQLQLTHEQYENIADAFLLVL